MFRFSRVSATRSRQIVHDISHASQPRGRFFVMLIASSMIASFGLIANSIAVIIGAMLVSPLMTPIFGIALGMLRGKPGLLLTALWCEALGVVLAIASAYLVGMPQLTFGEATTEMLARTQPSLLDLLVAVFAGFAGAYAMVDERVSPALPGVAIATAIVPPLSTCGLCLSLGAWYGAGGALLLFLANFVAILVVALLTFWASGLVPAKPRTTRQLIRHFGPTALAFVLMTVVLTNSLMKIHNAREIERGIQTTLAEELSKKHGADLETVSHKWDPSGVQVLAIVRSYRTISPTWVTDMEAALASTLDTPVNLVVRTVYSQDVSAVGSSLQVVRPDLNGDFLVSAPQSFGAMESLASQVLLEAFDGEPGIELTRVEYGESDLNKGIVVAYLNSLRQLRRDEIADIEQRLQLRFGDPSLHFYARVDSSALQDRNGPVRVEWSNVLDAGAEEAERLPLLTAAIQSTVEETLGLTPFNTDFRWRDGRWHALVEVFGHKQIGATELASVQQALPESCRDSVELLIWQRRDVVVTQEGFTTYDRLTAPLLQEQSKSLRRLFRSRGHGVTRGPDLVVSAGNTAQP